MESRDRGHAMFLSVQQNASRMWGYMKGLQWSNSLGVSQDVGRRIGCAVCCAHALVQLHLIGFTQNEASSGIRVIYAQKLLLGRH